MSDKHLHPGYSDDEGYHTMGGVGFGGYGTGEEHGRVNHCGERGAKTAGLAYIWGKGSYVGEDYPTMMVGGVSMVELRCRRLGDYSNCKWRTAKAIGVANGNGHFSSYIIVLALVVKELRNTAGRRTLPSMNFDQM